MTETPEARTNRIYIRDEARSRYKEDFGDSHTVQQLGVLTTHFNAGYGHGYSDGYAAAKAEHATEGQGA